MTDQDAGRGAGRAPRGAHADPPIDDAVEPPGPGAIEVPRGVPVSADEWLTLKRRAEQPDDTPTSQDGGPGQDESCP